MSSRSVPIESPYGKSYWWLIVTGIPSRTVSELSQLIVQILDTLRFWAALWGLRDNIRCSSRARLKACSRLTISVNRTFFARCYGWFATIRYERKEIENQRFRCNAVSLIQNSKTRNGRFKSKIALRLKKVCYKVSLCENCQRQSCKAFIGLTNRVKMIGGGQPLLPKILDQSDRIAAKSPIFNLISLLASQPYHLCEKCHGQNCKAFIGLTIRAKMIGEGDPFYLKFQSDRVWAKSLNFDLFSLISPEP